MGGPAQRARRADAGRRPPPLPAYRIDATLTLTPPQIRGTVTVDVTDSASVPLDRVLLVLFPNRFTEPDTTVNDVNRPYVWYREAFSPGAMHVDAVRVDGEPIATHRAEAPGVPTGCLLDGRLTHPIAPGGRVVLTADFVTTIPERYGTFGIADDTLTALGGWYPALAWLRPDGT